MRKLYVDPDYLLTLRRVWCRMRYRCRPEGEYGRRGITIAKEWGSFQRFVLDMHEGFRPQLQLDRIDPALGYSKENCQWLTREAHIAKTAQDARMKTLRRVRARLEALRPSAA